MSTMHLRCYYHTNLIGFSRIMCYIRLIKNEDVRL